MITPDIFKNNAVYRKRLLDAMDILEVAFMAINYDFDTKMVSAKPEELAVFCAKKQGMTMCQSEIREMAKVPLGELQPLEATHTGLDAFDQIAVNAEKQHEAEQARIKASQPKTKTKK